MKNLAGGDLQKSAIFQQLVLPSNSTKKSSKIQLQTFFSLILITNGYELTEVLELIKLKES